MQGDFFFIQKKKQTKPTVDLWDNFSMEIAGVASQPCDPREHPHPCLCFWSGVLSYSGKTTCPPGDLESSADSKEHHQRNTGGTVAVSGGVAPVATAKVALAGSTGLFMSRSGAHLGPAVYQWLLCVCLHTHTCRLERPRAVLVTMVSNHWRNLPSSPVGSTSGFILIVSWDPHHIGVIE